MRATADARLAFADQQVTSGQSLLAEGNYGDAFLLFTEAARSAQEAKLLFDTGKVRSSIELDFPHTTSEEGNNTSSSRSSLRDVIKGIKGLERSSDGQKGDNSGLPVGL